MLIKNARRFVLCGNLLLMAVVPGGTRNVEAQVAASLTGEILDTSGARITAATVTVRNLETGAVRIAQTDEAGLYTVLALPAGRYEVKVEKDGFEQITQNGVELSVGQSATVSFRLEVGTTRQTVTVRDDAQVVNTSTAQIAGLVSAEEIKDLPLNGRSFDNLITLGAGTMNNTGHTSSASTGSGQGSQFGVEGRTPEQNIFLLNGVEYSGNSQREVLPGGASGQLLGIDGIREFNVLTDTYSAEYGKRNGAQVLIVTQSGSNKIHGTVFEFLRNSHLDARNYFDATPTQIGHRLPEFQRNQFGGALGGPIQKDKVFVFGNYEGFRQELGVSDLAIVPDNNMRLGLLPNAKGVPTPVANLNPGMLPFFVLWPTANGPVLGGGLALNFSSPKQSIREDFGTMRVDDQLSSKDSLAGTYTIDNGYNLTPQSDPLFGGTFTNLYQVASLQETHVFSSNKINTFLLGFSRAQFTFNIAPVTAIPSNLSMFAGLEEGAITIGSTSTSSALQNSIVTAGGTAGYEASARNLFTYGDDYELIIGRHQLSFGAWFQRMQTNDNAQVNKTGTASFGSPTTFLQGITSNFIGVPDPTESGFRMWMGAWYAQDNMTIKPTLTLRVGLRHEFTNGWNEAHGRQGNFLFDPTTNILDTVPVTGYVYTQNNSIRLFSPRIGLAWDVFGNGKTAVRSGFGTYYDLQDHFAYAEDQEAPFNTLDTFGQNVPFLPLIHVAPGAPLLPQCNAGVPNPCLTIAPQGMSNTIKTPTVEAWNLSVEQQIAPSTSLRVAYVGSHAFHQITSQDLNSIHPIYCSNSSGCVSGGLNATQGFVTPGTLYVPVATTRPNPYLANAGVANSITTTSYNALQVELRRRPTKGLEVRGNYTWSKNLGSQDVQGTPQSTNGSNLLHYYDPKLDSGPSGMDSTNQAHVSASYELPLGQGKKWMGKITVLEDKLIGGWEVNSIITYMSGLPFTPTVSPDVSGEGTKSTVDRPNLNLAFTGPVITHNPNQWFNPNAFSIPQSGTFGNVSRGSFRGPSLAEWDMSMFKTAKLTEATRLQFRAEVFNVTNHTNFNSPNQLVFSSGGINPGAGIISSTVTTSRQIQFGLKLIF
jgi:hypothetical protein